MMALFLAPLALAGELSFAGKVIAIHRDRLSDFYFVKMQGMSMTLKSPPGETYTCLRHGLNSQDVLNFTFDPQTLKISDCRGQNLAAISGDL